MATASKVGAAPPAGITSVTDRTGSGGYFMSGDRIDGASGSQSVGISGQWRPRYDDGGGAGGFGQYRQPFESDPQFTPLVGRFAAAFQASETITMETRAAPPLFPSDMTRAVGIYEFNMKVIAGGFKSQGSVVNRYS